MSTCSCSLGFRAAAVGILEQTQALLESEHTAHGRIDLLDRYQTALQRDRQAVAIGVGHHVDVDSRVERQCRCCRQVGRDSVTDELPDRVVVADEDAIETQLAAQQVAQQSGVGRHWNAGKIAECGHDRRHTRGHCRLERRQVHLAQCPLGDVDGRVLSAGGDRTVCAEVLRTGRDRVAGRQVGSLIAVYLGLSDARREPAVLAGTLGSAPPPGVARHVQHGGESHREAVVRRLFGRFPRRLRPGLGVKQRRFGQRNRKENAVAVNNIERDQQRNPQAGFLDSQALHLLRRARAMQVQQVADQPAANGFGGVAGDDRPGYRIARGRHRELAQLLLERHRAQQRVDPAHCVLRDSRWAS